MDSLSTRIPSAGLGTRFPLYGFSSRRFLENRLPGWCLRGGEGFLLQYHPLGLDERVARRPDGRHAVHIHSAAHWSAFAVLGHPALRNALRPHVTRSQSWQFPAPISRIPFVLRRDNSKESKG